MRSEKKVWIASLLAFFFGIFGVQNWYMGHTKRAIIACAIDLTAIIMLVAFPEVPVIAPLILCVNIYWGLIDAIRILTGSAKDGKGLYILTDFQYVMMNNVSSDELRLIIKKNNNSKLHSICIIAGIAGMVLSFILHQLGVPLMWILFLISNCALFSGMIIMEIRSSRKKKIDEIYPEASKIEQVSDKSIPVKGNEKKRKEVKTETISSEVNKQNPKPDASVKTSAEKIRNGITSDADSKPEYKSKELKIGDSFRLCYFTDGSGPYHSETSVRLYVEKHGYSIEYSTSSPMGGGMRSTSKLSFDYFIDATADDFIKYVEAMGPEVFLYFRDITFDQLKEYALARVNEQNPKLTASAKASGDEILDDITYIRDMKHIPAEIWHQYDVLLEARGYGWDMMIAWADYMSQADLEHISQVTVSPIIGADEKDITESYSKNGCKCSQTPELKTEMGVLTVAGTSKALKAPMKIVWMNQTQVLRFFTIIDDELLMTKYVETVIRRTFGTENEMKLAKPIPEEQ